MAADVGRELRLVDLDADDTNADTSSVWALVTANLEFLALPKMQEPASQPELEQPALHWTDDFSSLWHIIR
jgi:hypothetical protein